MKKLLLALGLGFSLSFGFGHGMGGVNNIVSYVNSLPKEQLSLQEKKDLLMMREDEKLARDVYLTLYKKYGFRVFSNISKAESWHMEMVKSLLDKYGLADPIKSDEIGVFTNPKIKKLYDKLVAQGSKSAVYALKVGAIVEDLDIYDLDEAIKRSDNQDIKYVYSKLRFGSTHHMRAFVSWLKRYDATYTPQYISQVEFDTIISSSRGHRGMMR